jgi:hypothetical protein
MHRNDSILQAFEFLTEWRGRNGLSPLACNPSLDPGNQMWSWPFVVVLANACTGNDGIQVIMEHCAPNGSTIDVRLSEFCAIFTVAMVLRFASVLQFRWCRFGRLLSLRVPSGPNPLPSEEWEKLQSIWQGRTDDLKAIL